MTIVCDTREHEGKNQHILDYFDNKKIPWTQMKLDYGDYSFFLPKNKELGITRDLWFDNEICLERKANLEELSGNLSNERNRIKTEFAYSPPHKVMIVENSNYAMMVEGHYDTSYNPKSYWATVFSMWHQYEIPIIFLDGTKYTGQYIYGYFYYYLRNIIK